MLIPVHNNTQTPNNEEEDDDEEEEDSKLSATRHQSLLTVCEGQYH